MITLLTPDSAATMGPRLREFDLEVMRSLSYFDDPREYCQATHEKVGPKWMMLHDGYVEALGGLQVTCPGTLTGWVIASAGWERHKIEAIRHMKRVIDYAIASGAAKRVQAWVLADSPMANRMAQAVGLRLEATVSKLADGRDVNLYAKVAP